MSKTEQSWWHQPLWATVLGGLVLLVIGAAVTRLWDTRNHGSRIAQLEQALAKSETALARLQDGSRQPMQDEPARIRLQSLESRAKDIDVWLEDLTGSLRDLSDKLGSIEASGLSARLTDLETEGDDSQTRLDDLQGKIADLDAMAQRIAALEAGTRPKCAEIMQQAIAPAASGSTVGYRDDNGQWRTSAEDTRAAFVKLYNDLNCAEIAAPIPQR